MSTDDRTHEYFEITSKPKNPELLNLVKDTLIKQIKSNEKGCGYKDSFRMYVAINGNEYSSDNNLAKLKSVIKDELTSAERLVVDCYTYNGAYNMYTDLAENFAGKEKFNYRMVEDRSYDGIIWATIIDNGEDKALELTDEILSYPDMEMSSFGLTLAIDADFFDYPDVFEKLKKFIIANINESDMEFCLRRWDKNDEEFIPGIILPDTSFSKYKVSEIEGLLCELNKILSPIKDRISLIADEPSNYYNLEEMAYAEVKVIDNEFHLAGQILK